MRLCLLLLFPLLAHALDGRVVAVVDGDTVKVIDDSQHQVTIRLAGIDAPEKTQAFGQKSKISLAALVFNRDVTVQGEKTDRYGRTVAKLLTADPDCNDSACPKYHDVGLMQIQQGMAWWYRKYAKEQEPKDRADYEIAETMAKMKRLGLWSDKSPVPPWEYRH